MASTSVADWIARLTTWHQDPLVTVLSDANTSDADKAGLVRQLTDLDATTPGGLESYLKRAHDLLQRSRDGVNPFDGYRPEVPLGVSVQFNTPEFYEYESLGVAELPYVAFVLVAGGLGERLGYSGIKIELPSELSTGETFLGLYINYIVAFQRHARRITGRTDLLLPLAIMVSDDTITGTVALLEKHDYFGLPRSQIRLLKQEKVPALLDNVPHMATEPNRPAVISTKPHGHGDVHSLLHSSGLADQWHAEGRRWVFFFQDTNGVVMNALPLCLGVSARNDFAMNSLTVPRKAREAAGAICRLVHHNGSSLTVNVEYNQLDPLLRASGWEGGDRPDPVTGNSPFPGNVNVLVLRLSEYTTTLHASSGVCPEFVNPKYADERTKTTFKAPTRLECMMQDFPKLLPASAKVGFTQLDRWLCFSAVKNNFKDAAAKVAANLPPESAGSGEHDLYATHSRILRESCNAEHVHEDAHVTWSPSFAATVSELRSRVVNGADVSVPARSVLVLQGPMRVESVHVAEGSALSIDVQNPKADVTVAIREPVKNEGWVEEPVAQDDLSVPEVFRMRGYTLNKRGGSVHVISDEKSYTITH